MKKPTTPPRLSTKIKRQAWLASRKAESARIRALNKRRAEYAPDEILHVVDGVIVDQQEKSE